jgi:hypothetical protein
MTQRLSPHQLRCADEDAGGTGSDTLTATPAACDPASRAKAIVRIALLSILISQIVSAAFGFVAYRNHPDVALGLTTMVSFLLCAVLSVWIRSDAKHAYLDACELGYVSSATASGRRLLIARECPRRWLVVLHVELHGRIVMN